MYRYQIPYRYSIKKCIGDAITIALNPLFPNKGRTSPHTSYLYGCTRVSIEAVSSIDDRPGYHRYEKGSRWHESNPLQVLSLKELLLWNMIAIAKYYYWYRMKPMHLGWRRAQRTASEPGQQQSHFAPGFAAGWLRRFPGVFGWEINAISSSAVTFTL